MMALIIPAISFAGWGPFIPVNLWPGPGNGFDWNNPNGQQWFQGDPQVAITNDLFTFTMGNNQYTGPGLVVTWWGAQSDYGDIYLRRFYENPADGTVINYGNEVKVNDATFGNNLAQSMPDIAIDPETGYFIVVWQSATSTNPNYPRCQIIGRIFSWDMTTYDSGCFLIDDVYTTPPYHWNNLHPVVTVNHITSGTNYDFIVSWSDNLSSTESGTDYDVMFKVFHNNLVGGTELPANTITTGTQWNSSISSDSTGLFVIAWEGPDADLEGIYKRAFQVDWANQNGAAIDANDVLVNQFYQVSHELRPDVALHWFNGNYVIAWHANGNHDQQGSPPPYGSSAVVFQLFNADGTFNGSEHQANQWWQGGQRDPEVKIDRNYGHIVMVWDSESQDGSFVGIVVREFDQFGNPLANETVVNGFMSQGGTDGYNYAYNVQDQPALAIDSDCNVCIVWESNQWYEQNEQANPAQYDVFGKIMYCDQNNAIKLEDFNANTFGNSVLLSWDTGTEMDTVGYYVIRSTNLHSGFEVINSDMIAATGNQYSGASYSYVDNYVNFGSVYYYWLIAVDTHGQNTVYGPDKVVTKVWGNNIIK